MSFSPTSGYRMGLDKYKYSVAGEFLASLVFTSTYYTAASTVEAMLGLTPP